MTGASRVDGPDLIPVGGTTLIGTVLEFDDHRGVGLVGCGDRFVPFHCTAITDGSRHIEVGTVVAVRIGPARLGRFEARSVRPLPGVPATGGPGDDDRPGAPGAGPGDDYPAASVSVSESEDAASGSESVPVDDAPAPDPSSAVPADDAPAPDPSSAVPADHAPAPPPQEPHGPRQEQSQ